MFDNDKDRKAAAAAVRALFTIAFERGGPAMVGAISAVLALDALRGATLPARPQVIVPADGRGTPIEVWPTIAIPAAGSVAAVTAALTWDTRVVVAAVRPGKPQPDLPQLRALCDAHGLWLLLATGPNDDQGQWPHARWAHAVVTGPRETNLVTHTMVGSDNPMIAALVEIGRRAGRAPSPLPDWWPLELADVELPDVDEPDSHKVVLRAARWSEFLELLQQANLPFQAVNRSGELLDVTCRAGLLNGTSLSNEALRDQLGRELSIGMAKGCRLWTPPALWTARRELVVPDFLLPLELWDRPGAAVALIAALHSVAFPA